MSVLNLIRNKFIEVIAVAVKNRLNGRDLTIKLEAEMDKKLGKGLSETLQDGLIVNLLFEMVEGLYDDNPDDLVPKIQQWVVDYRTRIGDYEKKKSGNKGYL